jgi:hypothetical protein
MRATRAILALSCLLVAASFVPQAGATVITVPMSGTIDTLFDPTNALGGFISQGETWSFTVSYEDSVPDLDPDPALGTYDLTSFAFSGQVGGVAFQYDGASESFASVGDGPLGGGDEFDVTTGISLAVTPGSSTAFFSLLNPIGLAITSDDLTAIPYAFRVINGGWLDGFFDIEGPNWHVAGPITGLNGVPEPATGVSLLLGLGALALRRPHA